MKILAFGASTSSKSINRQLAYHAAHRIAGGTVTELDLRDLSLPLYSIDAEEAEGIPANAQRFFDMIREHDAIVISMAEHNGSYAAGFKNLYDWSSRIDPNVWADKPMLLLATSPGGRGGQTVLESAKATFPRMGADLKASFSLPSFYDNFKAESGVQDPALAKSLEEAIATMTA